MDDITSIVPIVKKAFIMNADDPVDYIIKYGIHKIFAESIKEQDASQEQIKRSIMNALTMIAKINPNMVLSDGGDDANVIAAARQELVQTRYFSSGQGSLVEFFINRTTGKFNVRTKNEDSTDQTKPSTPWQTNNDIFKSAVIRNFLSVDPNLIERLVLTGVIMTLEFGEDRDAPFMDLFNDNYALFGKLKQVYEKESVESLAAENGDFSIWCDVVLAVEKYELEKEDEAMAMEG